MSVAPGERIVHVATYPGGLLWLGVQGDPSIINASHKISPHVLRKVGVDIQLTQTSQRITQASPIPDPSASIPRQEASLSRALLGSCETAIELYWLL